MGQENGWNITRRQFLNLIGRAASSLVAASLLKPTDRLIRRENFVPDMLVDGSIIPEFEMQIVRERLVHFGEMVEFEDKDEWNGSVETVCSALQLINELRETGLEQEDSLVMRIGENDYKTLNSMVWLVLKVEELYRDNPRNLRSIMRLPSFPEILMNDVMPQSGSPWLLTALRQLQQNPDGRNVIRYLFEAPFFLDNYVNDNMPYYRSSEQQQQKLQAYGKGSGAIETVFAGEDIPQSTLEVVAAYLKKLNLSSVANRINFQRGQALSGNIYGENPGEIHITLRDQDIDKPFEHDDGLREYILHEIGHIVWELAKLIPDTEDKNKVRIILQDVVRRFWPTNNLDTFLHPQGKYRTISDLLVNNEGVLLNEAVITAYSSGYFLSHLKTSGDSLMRACLRNPTMLGVEKDDDISRLKSLTHLEDRIIQRAKQILPYLLKTERRVSRLFGGAIVDVSREQMLMYAGIPLAIQDLLQSSRQECIGLIMQCNPDFDARRANILIESYFSEVESVLEIRAGDELFADLFQCALRKDSDNVVNELSDDRLNKTYTDIKIVLDILFKYKLANK